MNPFTRYYQASGDTLLYYLSFNIGCTYNPMKYICDEMVRNMATTSHEFTDYERGKVFFGHYPRGSSIRAWHHLY